MATIPIIGNVTVGGARKEISGGYVNIGGVWKPIVKTYVNVNGVWKNAWKELYTWKKYTVKSVTVYKKVKSSSTSTQFLANTEYSYCSSTYTFDETTGIYTLTNPSRVKTTSLSTTKKYYRGTEYGNSMSEYVSKKTGVTQMQNDTIVEGCIITRYRYTAEADTTTELQGDYISDVTSENSSAYPTNGKHTDGYWYVKQ